MTTQIMSPIEYKIPTYIIIAFLLQGGPKNGYPVLFEPFFHCYKQNLVARKREILPPTTPLLCDHIT